MALNLNKNLKLYYSIKEVAEMFELNEKYYKELALRKAKVSNGLTGKGELEAWIYYRDVQGRVQGTVTTDRYGKTTYRDARGRVQGSATTDRYGKTVYRDSLGRVQGSKTTR